VWEGGINEKLKHKLKTRNKEYERAKQKYIKKIQTSKTLR
jgi:hypothetical protein